MRTRISTSKERRHDYAIFTGLNCTSIPTKTAAEGSEIAIKWMVRKRWDFGLAQAAVKKESGPLRGPAPGDGRGYRQREEPQRPPQRGWSRPLGPGRFVPTHRVRRPPHNTWSLNHGPSQALPDRRGDRPDAHRPVVRRGPLDQPAVSVRVRRRKPEPHPYLSRRDGALPGAGGLLGCRRLVVLPQGYRHCGAWWSSCSAWRPDAC
jgi:hypothetical protein